MFPEIGSLVIVGVLDDGRYVGTLVGREGSFVALKDARYVDNAHNHRVDGDHFAVEEAHLRHSLPTSIAYQANWMAKCVVEKG